MDLIARILPEHDTKRRWVVAFFIALISGLFTLWGIYGIGEYGMAMFILTPVFIGVGSTVLYGWGRSLKMYESWSISLLTLLVFSFGLLFFAIEGILCVFMVVPIAVVLTIAGSFLGYYLHSRRLGSGSAMVIIFLSMPLVSFVEHGQGYPLQSVVSSIEIDASPEVVWEQVIQFPELKEPEEFIFKTGIAYPINARIEGQGPGAVRYCNFTTGSFVEPITVWKEASLLKFDVEEQPAPMQEWAFWDIRAPHLHDYFVSKEGQFRLIALEGGKTRLEGTTWYYHKIRPAFYWQLWSSYIIHKIHNRVLEHIKHNSEVLK